MRDHRYLDDLSIDAALARWRAGEAAFAARMTSTTVLTLPMLDRWLADWDLTDRLRRGQREQVRAFLEDTARPLLCGVLSPSADAYALVDQLNFQAVQARITTASLMVLLSRFACSCEPTVYAPLTQYSRRGIQILGRRLDDMSYRTYMLAFAKEKERFAARAATSLLARAAVMDGRPAMPLDVLAMRATDRRLMLAGGFPPERLEAMVAAAKAETLAPMPVTSRTITSDVGTTPSAPVQPLPAQPAVTPERSLLLPTRSPSLAPSGRPAVGRGSVQRHIAPQAGRAVG